MSNSANPRKQVPKSPRQAAATRAQTAAGELKYSLTIEAPDAEGGGEHRIDVDLRMMTLAERELVKRALEKAVQPPGYELIVLVNAWVIWRRTHPTSSLNVWMNDIVFGDILDGLNIEPGRNDFTPTPEDYDPEVSRVA